MQAGRANYGRGLVLALGIGWTAAAALTLARQPATPKPTACASVDEFAPATSGIRRVSSAATNPSSGVPVNEGSPDPKSEHHGIKPPWHENFIPEMRHEPGKKQKKTTA